MYSIKLLLAMTVFTFLSYMVLPTLVKKLRLKDSEKMKNSLPVTANAKAGLFILAGIIGLFFIIYIFGTILGWD
ncbi:MAG TPA: hypothetical protein VJC13_03150 [Candidatus Paceibacterota bacterium]